MVIQNLLYPLTNAFVGGAWNGAGSGQNPNVVITFSDGTLGWLDGTLFTGLYTQNSWTDATDPDERGIIFQVPFACKIGGLWTFLRSVDATSDFTLTLYSDPEGVAPVAEATVTVDADQAGAAANNLIMNHGIASQVSLLADTDYCIAVKATGAGNLRVDGTVLAAAAHRAIFPGSTTLRQVTRNGGAGAFGSSSTTTMMNLGVMISEITTSTDGGTGSNARQANLRGNMQ